MPYDPCECCLRGETKRPRLDTDASAMQKALPNDDNAGMNAMAREGNASAIGVTKRYGSANFRR
jgi:ABC-type enterochelin transport system substrate-binding protein